MWPWQARFRADYIGRDGTVVFSRKCKVRYAAGAYAEGLTGLQHAEDRHSAISFELFDLKAGCYVEEEDAEAVAEAMETLAAIEPRKPDA